MTALLVHGGTSVWDYANPNGAFFQIRLRHSTPAAIAEKFKGKWMPETGTFFKGGARPSLDAKLIEELVADPKVNGHAVYCSSIRRIRRRFSADSGTAG
jgi:hypothetical protein